MGKIRVGFIGGIGLYAAYKSLYNVEGGHRAVVCSTVLLGVKDNVYPEGTHFMIPWFERPIIYDVRALHHTVEGTSGSRDLQMVKDNSSGPYTPYARAVANYLPNPWLLVGKFEKKMAERAAAFNLALDDVSIISLTFGKEFTAAIEAKQIAAQEVEMTKFVVEKAEQDKKSAIIRAQGEAKSAQLIGEAIANNKAFISLRKIEAAQEIAHTISKSTNRVFLNSDELLLNLQGMILQSPPAK
ncbi:prohibitin 1 [Actinidia rufa]|uniref:Prohibitin n=1 Tax=Actinidia rufa TaxID=165716 RepID=A0A7J0F1Y3_9ERIC|nr:prohibitin 1 [Actinidia rufa]